MFSSFTDWRVPSRAVTLSLSCSWKKSRSFEAHLQPLFSSFTDWRVPSKAATLSLSCSCKTRQICQIFIPHYHFREKSISKNIYPISPNHKSTLDSIQVITKACQLYSIPLVLVSTWRVELNILYCIVSIFDILTLKAPRKNAPEKWCLLMSSAANFSITLLTNLSIEADRVDPHQTAPIGQSDLGPPCLS